VLQQTLAHLESDERDIPWCVAVETRAALEQRQLVATFGLRADKEELGSSLLDPLPDITAQDDAPVTLRTPIRHRETTGERPPASRAVWLPIYADPELSSREVGGLIMGLSDHLAYDEPYQLFIESIRRSVSAAIQHRIYRDTELTNAERRYSAVFENALDAIMLTSPSDEILHANAAACELLGYTEHELRQLGRKDIIDPEDGRLEAAVSVRASTGEFRGELGLKHRDGHIIPCELSSKLYHDAEGKPRTSVVFRDMRERLQLEAKLRQSQKLEVIGKLAGGVAHDFNNLLTAIDASAQFLEQSIEPGTEAAEDVSVIRSASDRAAGLTQRLLAFSRKGTDESTVLEPEGLVTGISSILRSLLGEGIELVLQLDSDLHPIRASRQRLEQLLLNLLVNAHDAMPDGGSIRIEVTNRELESEPDDLVIGTTSPGEYVQISVIDSGEGLPPNQHTRLFEPFYTTKKHGTGLGLATVAEVVRDCAGAILVQSERDVCTRFDILLPATHDLPDESDNGEFAAPTIGPLSGRVLLIEDQPRVRKVTRRMLECAGLEVATASGGPDAIALVEHAEPQRFDLVISDIVMPKMSGVQTVRHLRNIDSNLKFLFISGYPNRENLHLSTENPIPLIRKPFTSTELLAAVEELVA
jgi:PAS domain S-box-containing protein